jgi:prepilin-type N-terminal cleavage/methylation domain-containing protein
VIKANGFTLIEVVISVAIMALLGTVIALLLNSIIESWQYTQNRMELYKASTDIINELIQGGFEAKGIRDAVDFISCGTDSMTFLPLWVDQSHRPDPLTNKEQRFTLNRQFKVGSSVPLAQIKGPDSDSWTTAKVKFTYGEGANPKQLDDVIQVLDAIPKNGKVKFTFTPEPTSDLNVQKSFTWNAQNKHIYASYKGQTQDLLKTLPEVKVERLQFIYFDNLNQQVAADDVGYLSDEQIKRTSAVKVYLLLSRKGDWRESVSYCNIRNTQGVGVTIVEGSLIPIPSSERIKALSIGNFFKRKKNGIVRIRIKPENRKHWVIELKIIKDSSDPQRLMVERFQIESPPGKILTSSILNQSFMIDEYVNLLVLDRTGLYDYDDDEGINDFYLVDEENVPLEVERLDFSGAALFLRP